MSVAITDLSVKIKADSGQLTSGLKKAGQDVKNFQREATKNTEIFSDVGGFTKNVRGLEKGISRTLGIFGIGVDVSGMVRETADTLKQAFSNVYGSGADAIRKMRTEIDMLNTSMMFTNRPLAQVQDRTHQLTEGMGQAPAGGFFGAGLQGIGEVAEIYVNAFKNSNGSLTSIAVQLPQAIRSTARAVRQLRDEAEANALLVETASRSSVYKYGRDKALNRGGEVYADYISHFLAEARDNPQAATRRWQGMLADVERQIVEMTHTQDELNSEIMRASGAVDEVVDRYEKLVRYARELRKMHNPNGSLVKRDDVAAEHRQGALGFLNENRSNLQIFRDEAQKVNNLLRNGDISSGQAGQGLLGALRAQMTRLGVGEPHLPAALEAGTSGAATAIAEANARPVNIQEAMRQTLEALQHEAEIQSSQGRELLDAARDILEKFGGIADH
jgi:hypothetical protein